MQSDIFLFILDGRVPDEGACVELGIAYCQRFIGQAKERLFVGLQTDVRASFTEFRLNPMVEGPLDFIATDCDQVLLYLKRNKNASSSKNVNSPPISNVTNTP